MNFKKIISTLVVAAMLGLGLSSCTKTAGNDTVVMYPLSGCFALVTDNHTGATYIYHDVNYSTEINLTQGTAVIDLTGLELPSTGKLPQVKISGLKAGAEGAWSVLSASDPKVSMSGFGTIPLFKNFKMEIFDRMFGTLYVPGLSIRYNVDGQYDVFSAREGQIVVGKLESISPDGKTFTNADQLVGLTFDTNTMKVTIELSGASFATGMPAQNIVLKDVPFTLSSDGEATIKIDAITPMIGDTPYPQFPISNLEGEFDFNDGLDLDFVCTIGPTPYNVEIEADFGNK